MPRVSTYCAVQFYGATSKLFEGAKQRLSIYVQSPASRSSELFSGGYLKWSEEEREVLFQRVRFDKVSPLTTRKSVWPKTYGADENKLMLDLMRHSSLVGTGALNGEGRLYYKNTGLRYFSTVTRRPPKCKINGIATSSSRETILRTDEKRRNRVHCLLLSSAFYCFWQWTSNGRDLNPADIDLMPCPKLSDPELDHLSDVVETDYESKARFIVMNNKKTGRVELESLSPARSKSVIDEIDRVLARQFGLADHQLDLILNYDIKYRMGKGGDGDSDD